MRDYTDDLSAVENSLRLIIERVGQDTYGADYLPRLNVVPKSIKDWERNRTRETERRGAGIREERLLYFSNFSDLEKIVLDNWPLFEPVFKRRDQAEVFLSKLRELRNPDAHRRELTEAEKSLIVGMAGELRTQIIRYLSERDTPDEYFPRMESLRDSLGNSFNPPKRPVVRVGATIEFIAEAWDPFGATLEYQWSVQPHHPDTFQDWSHNNRFTWHVQPNQVANPAWVSVNMRGPREPHAEGHRDAGWSIAYTVLPAVPLRA
jgi:hypothetical protein